MRDAYSNEQIANATQMALLHQSFIPEIETSEETADQTISPNCKGGGWVAR